MKRVIFKVVVIMAAILVFTAGMVELRAREMLDRAHRALTLDDHSEALKYYSRVLCWYLPGGAAETAAEELLAKGMEWYNAGSYKNAGLALSRMRSGLYGAQSFFVPCRDLIAQAEPVLARIRAREKLGPEAPAGDLDRQAAVYLDLMQRPARPGLAPASAASGGFLLWVVSVLLFIAHFFKPRSGGWGRAWPWIPVWGAGFTLWIWGMKWA